MTNGFWTRLIRGFLGRPSLLFGAWAFWLSLEYWCFGASSYLFIHDSADHYIPIIMWFTQGLDHLLDARILPVLTGLDRAVGANWMNAFSWPFLVLQPWWAHGLVMFVQRFVAGYFAYRFLKDGLRIHGHICVAAGLAYTLVNIELGEVRLMHGLDEPGFPLLLWFLIRVPLHPLHRGLVPTLAMGWLFALTMGPFIAMPFLLSTAFGVALVLREDLGTDRGWLRLLMLFVLLCAVCWAPHLPKVVALAMNSPEGHRASWTAGAAALSDHELLRAWITRFVQRRSAFAASWWGAFLLGALWLFRRGPRGRPDAATAFLLLVGFLAGPVFGYLSTRYAESLGFLRGFTVTRFDKVAYFAMIAVAAMGVDVFARKRWNAASLLPGQAWSVPLSACLALVLAAMALHESILIKEQRWAAMRHEGKTWRLMFNNPEIMALRAQIGDEPVRSATAGAHHLHPPMYLLGYGLEIADGYVDMLPKRYHDFWAEVIRPLCEKDPGVAGFFAWGCRVYLFHPGEDESLNISQIPFADYYNLNLLSLANVRYLVSSKPIVDTRLVRRPPAITDEMRAAWGALPFWTKARRYLRGDAPPGAEMYVYENPDALARYFIATDARGFDTDEEIRAELRTASLDRLKQQVLLLRADLGDAGRQKMEGSAEVRLITYSPDEAELEVDVTGNVYLVASNLYYPWWTCRVDGQPAKILPAYSVFQAVKLGPGAHTVHFRYEPPYNTLAQYLGHRN